MKKPLVMLLAGGGGTRLGVLVKHRAKPAVPFGGRYRIIDFALSNVMHAELDHAGVLTQYKPLSLMEHIGVGEAWNLYGHLRGVHTLPPRTGEADSDWYQGTADAIWQNMDFMKAMKPERVLVLSGDHIYRMDYQRMVAEHVSRKADVSIAVMDVAAEDVSRFGMIWADGEGSITRFEEKPARADTRLASMGIYVFEWPCLVEALERIVATRIGNDFGHDIMPRLLGPKRMLVHRFDGYWRDVGTISSYFQANMDLLRPSSGLDLDRWEIGTRDDPRQVGDRPPVRFGTAASCDQVLVSDGCRIDGRVRRSVLSPDVTVEAGAEVEDAILMHGVVIRRGAVVRRAVLDKGVILGAGARILGGSKAAPNAEYAKCQLDGLSVLGKDVQVPDGVSLGANVVCESGAGGGDFKGDVPDGATVRASGE
ncbi:MAG: NTP transferase domain-containing protein [Deltaproteobacteria bacterium]|nr:NTP transferase domain-containing protein [Deltaproteobacteria bacterium]